MKPETGSTKPESAAAGRTPGRPLLPAVFAVLLVLSGAVFYFLYRDEPPVKEDKTPRASTLAPRTYLTARGRVPRPQSMDPSKFSDPEVRQAYEVARNDPELLENMPCYCGCYRGSGHASNYDCFADDHGAT